MDVIADSKKKTATLLLVVIFTISQSVLGDKSKQLFIEENFDVDEDTLLLNLSGKGLATLNNFNFGLYPNVEEIDLSNNNLQSIREETFQDNAKLRKLTFANNKNLHIPEFSTLLISNVEELNLTGCNIYELPFSIFDGLQMLKVIDLRNNPLTILDALSFSALIDPELILLPKSAEEYVPEICSVVETLKIIIESKESTTGYRCSENGVHPIASQELGLLNSNEVIEISSEGKKLQDEDNNGDGDIYSNMFFYDSSQILAGEHGKRQIQDEGVEEPTFISEEQLYPLTEELQNDQPVADDEYEASGDVPIEEETIPLPEVARRLEGAQPPPLPVQIPDQPAASVSPATENDPKEIEESSDQQTILESSPELEVLAPESNITTSNNEEISSKLDLAAEAPYVKTGELGLESEISSDSSKSKPSVPENESPPPEVENASASEKEIQTSESELPSEAKESNPESETSDVAVVVPELKPPELETSSPKSEGSINKSESEASISENKEAVAETEPVISNSDTSSPKSDAPVATSESEQTENNKEVKSSDTPISETKSNSNEKSKPNKLDSVLPLNEVSSFSGKEKSVEAPISSESVSTSESKPNQGQLDAEANNNGDTKKEESGPALERTILGKSEAIDAKSSLDKKGTDVRAGESTESTSKSGTNILIVLVVAVVCIGAAAFAYRWYKNRQYQAASTEEPVERELKEISIQKNGLPKQEQEPLMNKSDDSANNKDERVNESKET